MTECNQYQGEANLNAGNENRLLIAALRVASGLVLLVLSACTDATGPVADTKIDDGVRPGGQLPNIVVILVDDLGYADIGAYNNDTFYETPNIDRLAREGAQFTDGYAANPVCSPSRYALLTGKHPTRHAATDWFHRRGASHRAGKFAPAQVNQWLPHSETTLAEALQKNGYRTVFLGKWHLGEAEEFWPEKQGFEFNVGGHDKGQPPGGYFSPYENPRLDDGPDGEYLTKRLTDEAIDYVNRFASEDDPFLIYLSYYSVHTPLQAPENTVAKYEKKGSGLRSADDDFAPEEQIWPTSEKRLVRTRQNHAIYGAMIEELDVNVGRLLDSLRSSGINDNTLVVFTSDNGGLSTAEGSPTSNSPLRGGKGWLYEGGIRVPFIIRAPVHSSNGSTITVPVNGTDIFPTLLDYAGLDLLPGQHIDGVSLLPLLSGEGSDDFSNRPMYWHYPHYSNQGGMPGAAVRLGNWKLIENFEDGEVSLYNLATDPGERRKVTAEEPGKVAELKAMLHDWYRETDAKFLSKNPDRPEYGEPWRPE
jgi:arylsulfatase A-like enzyme